MVLSRIALPLIATAALAGLSLAAPASPIQAQTSGPYFQAELVNPTEESRIVAGGILWSCDGTSCTAPRAGKRPLRACRDLFRKVGEISSFVVDGEALEESRMVRCTR